MASNKKMYVSKMACVCCSTQYDNFARKSIKYNPDGKPSCELVTWINGYGSDFRCNWCMANCAGENRNCNRKGKLTLKARQDLGISSNFNLN